MPPTGFRPWMLPAALLLLLAAGALSAQPSDPGAFDDGLDAILGGEAISEDVDGSSWLTGWKGFVALESRVFLEDRNQNQEGEDSQLLLEAELELDFRLGRRLSAYFRPRVFIDWIDDDLERFEPFEAYLTFEEERWDLRVGQMVENWGIADTYNPVDILNRRDLGSDLLDPDRLGELGVRYRRLFRGGDTFGEPTLTAYAMPVFRRARFAPDGQRFGLGNGERSFSESGGFEPEGSDEGFYALRLQSTLTTAPLDADLQLVVARGPERAPLVASVGLDPDGRQRLVPVYYGAETYGAGLRAVPNESSLGTFLASLTLKAEIVHKEPFRFDAPFAAPAPYTAWVLGVDRVFDNALRAQDQLTLTLEWASESGDEDLASRFRPFRDDLVVRLFWEWNDFSRTSLEIRALYDLETDETLLEGIFETQLRRLHEDLQLQLSAQSFDPPGTGVSFFDLFPDNSNLSLRLTWDF